MGNFFKGLRISNSSANKVIYTDENGNLRPSNKTVNDLVTTDVTNDLANRVSTLEGEVSDVGQRLSNING